MGQDLKEKATQNSQVDYEDLNTINRTDGKKICPWQRSEHRGSPFERIIIGTYELINVQILFS